MLTYVAAIMFSIYQVLSVWYLFFILYYIHCLKPSAYLILWALSTVPYVHRKIKTGIK